MATKHSKRLTNCFILLLVMSFLSASPEVCTNSLIPGAKGDQGEIGDVGEEGVIGKAGPPGHPGNAGDAGIKGDMGHIGKMGPIGDKGDKGDPGMDGPGGLKGTPGSTCDCGRYRRLVGPIDINLDKLRNALKFVKNVLLGLRETEERYYLLVKEAKMFQEASMNCRLRGGVLAMPKTPNTNQILADYISQSHLTRVYVGVKANSDTNGTRSYMYSDSTPLQTFSGWSDSPPSTNSSCVELLSSGTWAHTQCDNSMFFICEFPKSRRRGGIAPTLVS
ncbi:collectin-10 [Periophthalmus magnuspinnatus]|uniref:collectin-10 n=1 Tax=Periophthalmus magnuspinnatus TaxID=409849 RepID=UPI00145A3A51|nr:collectin-10 [Periophthalmus magnuspinnatus]